MNILAFGTDSYKQSHHNFYPPETEVVYSYCESRVGARFPSSVFFGLQYIMKKYLEGQVVTQDKIEEAATVCEAHFGRADVFNREGWEYILRRHDGYLPIEIKAVPEGTIVPTSNVLFTIKNLDPKVPWLTNFLETILMQVWSPITVATSSYEIRNIIRKYLDQTGDPAGLDFKLHDFGYRGVSSVETAALAGAAHLVTGALGTDTLAAIQLLRDYYNEPMAGFSVSATEHSIMTAGGPEGEADVVRRVLQSTPSDQMVAIVGDSYDMMRFVTTTMATPDIKELILQRTAPTITRPDSGKLPKIDIDVFNALESVFGTEINNKGFRVLHPAVRMIQGDGIKWNPIQCVSGMSHIHTVEVILQAFQDEGISADNIAFGSGGGLLQDFNRDTQRFAIKCSAMRQGTEWVDIYKQPATDPAKNSKRGLLSLVRRDDGTLETICGTDQAEGNILQTVFCNGIVTKQHTLSEIRDRVNG